MTGAPTDADDPPDVLDAAQARRVQHLGARLAVRVQAGDGVVEVGVAADQVLGARGQHQAGLDGGRLDRGGDPLRRERAS